MGMMDQIYDRPQATNSLVDMKAGQCVSTPAFEREEKEIRRSTIAEQVVERVKTARRANEKSYRLERFAELGDRHPEVLEMLEIARDMNLL